MCQYAGVLQINLAAIRSNWQFLRQSFTGAACGSVIKANAYGLGVAPVAQALYSEGCRDFFVATYKEGVQVKRLLPLDAQVYVLQGCRKGAERTMIESGLIPVLSSLQMIERWLVLPAALVKRCVIKVNSGMNRLGLSPSEFQAVLTDERLPSAGVQMLLSHMACADQPLNPLNALQLQRFQHMLSACREVLPNIRASLANSATVFLPNQFHFDVARPGIALFGSGHPQLASVVSLHLPVLQVRNLSLGEAVGYGADFYASRDMRVAIVAGGYADGIFRSLSNVAQGWFGESLPMLGRVSMDSCVFDISSLAAEFQPQEGDLIEVLGEHRPLDKVAEEAGTISYELLTRLGQRFERRYCE